MKRIKLYCAATLVSLFTFLSAPSVLSLGTLKEISTPYVGEYKCKALRIGSKQFSADGVRLQLSADGKATLYWKTAFGKEQSQSYAYEYNEEEGTFHVSVTLGKEKKNFKIPYRGGEIEIAETLAGKAIFAKFSKK